MFGPTPQGYTRQEWRQLWLDALETEPIHDVGGIPMISIEVDMPIVFEGEAPEIELVGMTEEEMDSAGVLPGDFSDDSTSEHIKTYILEEFPSDPGGDYEDDSSFGFSEDTEDEFSSSGEAGLDTFYYCVYPFYCQLWNYENGSGLVYPKVTYIKTKSKSFTATTNYRWGTATFLGGGTAPVKFSGKAKAKTLTTYYSLMAPFYVNGNLVYGWLVYNPVTWVQEGEDAWDSIVLSGDGGIGTNPIYVDGFEVQHNNTVIGNTIGEAPNAWLNSSNPDYDITFELDADRTEWMCGLTNNTVEIAVGDLFQGASIDYPVYSHPNNSIDPYTGQAPNAWCSEFTSWAFRENDSSLGNCTGCEHIPEPGAPKIDNPIYSTDYWPNDIGVGHFFEWADNTGRLVYYGDDSSQTNNGPDSTEWAALATLIGPGDYVAFNQCADHACTNGHEIAHSMVVQGWWNGVRPDNGVCDVGHTYFDNNRECNVLATVSGNADFSPPGRACWYGYTVCRRPVQHPFFPQIWLDPPCDINGDGDVDSEDSCDIRLWDTHTGNLVYSEWEEGGFFALMP